MPRELIQRKVFVGGLPVRVTKEEIVSFFSQFGHIDHCQLKLNSRTKRCLGFSCLTFRHVSEAERLFGKQVEFRGRICECKRVLIKTELKNQVECEKKKKILVLGLPDYLQNHDLFEALTHFKKVSHAYVVKNENVVGKNKGFGFVIFVDEEAKESFLIQTQQKPLKIDGLEVFFSKDLTHPLQKQKKIALSRLAKSYSQERSIEVLKRDKYSPTKFQKERGLRDDPQISPQNYMVFNAWSLGTTNLSLIEENDPQGTGIISSCCQEQQNISSERDVYSDIYWENNLNIDNTSSTKASILRVCSRCNSITNNYRLNGPLFNPQSGYSMIDKRSQE